MTMNLIFLGPPGCGKGTQAAILEKKLGFLHASTGDLLREITCENSDLASEIKEIITSGSLVTDEKVNEIVESYYYKNKDANGIILDGYPRNAEQAEFLKKLLDSFGKKVDRVFYLDVDEDVVIKRIVGRYSCKNCGAVYNRNYNNTKIENECDVCHNHDFCTRSDDNEEVVKHRLDVYQQSTAPLLEYYKDILIKISADNSLDEVSAMIIKNL